jgi:hypothetical protein
MRRVRKTLRSLARCECDETPVRWQRTPGFCAGSNPGPLYVAGGDVKLRERDTRPGVTLMSPLSLLLALRGWLPEWAILPAGGGKEHVAAGVVGRTDSVP